MNLSPLEGLKALFSGDPRDIHPSADDSASDFSLEVDFTESDSKEGELVPLVGRLSRAGEYPDKNITLTEADFDAAAAEVSPDTPVPMNLAHVRRGVPIFDKLPGGLGKIVRVWREGSELFGEIAAPRWLLNLAKEAGVTRLPLSAEWGAGKRLTGVAWEKHPRIHDAQLLAAFSSFLPQRGAQGPALPASAAPPTPPQGTSPTMKNPLAWLAKVFPYLNKEMDATALFADALAEAEAQEKPADFSAQLDPLKQQLDDLRSRAIRGQADGTVDAWIRAKKALPAEREGLIALFTQAARDDEGGGTVEFTVGGQKTQVSRLEALKQSIESRTTHGLTEEMLPEDATVFTSYEKRDEVKYPSASDVHRMKFESERKASGRG